VGGRERGLMRMMVVWVVARKEAEGREQPAERSQHKVDSREQRARREQTLDSI
jgi:hypothetical protein